MLPKGNGHGKQSVADRLASGPASFLELMVAAGSRDGRELVRELDALYSADKLTRHDISNTNPGAEGGNQIQRFRIEGDLLILTTEDPKSKAEVRFQRARKTS